MSQYNYEESVHWMRSQPELADMVKFCYLDEDNLVAAKRFSGSEEFEAITHLLKLYPSVEPLTILDLGCGNGIASYAFASLGHNVHAVDPDESSDVGLGAISRLQQSSIKGSITIAKSFAESLPLESNTFDVVYTRQAVHHFADLEQGLKECARVLKLGGKFLATREHVVSDEQQLQNFLANHILHKMHDGENAYPLKVYTGALEHAGLKVVKCFGPFETIINHFPTSNSEISELLAAALESKFGKAVAVNLIKAPLVSVLGRRYLSRSCDFPGRFYSFLCRK